jgi:hypothetical protein
VVDDCLKREAEHGWYRDEVISIRIEGDIG